MCWALADALAAVVVVEIRKMARFFSHSLVVSMGQRRNWLETEQGRYLSQAYRSLS
jgi:hypothetical protein